MKRQRFPQVTSACNEAIQQYISHILKHSDPFISQLPEFPIYEGYNTQFLQMGGAEIGDQADKLDEDFSPRISELGEVTGKGLIEKEDIRDIRLGTFKKMLLDIAQGLNKERGRTVISQLNTILNDAGQSGDAEGKPFTFELWLQTIEQMEIEFDEQGTPIYPTMVIPPKMKQTVEKVFQEAAFDAEKKQALEGMLQRKRETFNAKENNRKLVD